MSSINKSNSTPPIELNSNRPKKYLQKQDEDKEAQVIPNTSSKEENKNTVKQQPFKEKNSQRKGKVDPDDGLTPEIAPFTSLFRSAKGFDLILVIFGILSSLGMGSSQPILVLIVGDMLNQYTPDNINTSLSDKIFDKFILMLISGAVSIVFFFMGIFLLKIASFNVTKRLRVDYLNALLRQEQAWHDTNKMVDITSRAEADIQLIMTAIETKMGLLLQGISTFIGGFVVAFIKGWQLALVCCGLIPVNVILLIFLAVYMSKQQKVRMEEYGKAGAFVTAALQAIRTVVGLGGEDQEINKYVKVLTNMRSTIAKNSIRIAICFGFMYGFQNILYAISFYVGSVFLLDGYTNPITNEPYQGGDITVVFVSLINASFAITMISPQLGAIHAAKLAAGKIYRTIDRKSKIDVTRNEGECPKEFIPKIQFKGVQFSYPSKEEQTILKGIDLTFESGQRTALVGESGCGKSTCMMLIQRFYDPKSGEITLNGKNLKGYNLQWLRKNIAYVGQEPVLFSTTIKENLKYAKQDASDDEINQALKKANALSFIKNLDEGINTYVGEGGTQLSGGQKQRIAIARAILKQAKILLLDEATSALDRKNEREIQETLDHISKETTTILIAHRLSTVRNANKIYMFEKGEVVECGTHEELQAKEGKYYNLTKAQLLAEDQNQADDAGLEDIQIAKKDETRKSEKSEKSEKKAKIETGVEFRKNVKKAVKMWKTIKRLYNDYAKKEKLLLFFCYLSSFVNGLSAPGEAIIMAFYINAYLNPIGESLEGNDSFWSWLYVIIAVTVFICMLGQKYSFEMISEDLTKRLRKDVYSKFLSMNIGWHDSPQNISGKLSTALQKDTERLSEIIGNTMGSILQVFSSLTSGLLIGFIFSWKLTLIAMSIFPFSIIFTRIKAYFVKVRALDNDGHNNASKIVIESVLNNKTVASLCAEQAFAEKYKQEVYMVGNHGRKYGAIVGLLQGLTRFMLFLFFGVMNITAADFIGKGELTVLNFFIVQWTILQSVGTATSTMALMSDIGKALSSADILFKYLDEKSSIDTFKEREDTKKIHQATINGHIEFKNVSFKYPTRDKQIFKDLNITINPGEKIAFVGSSGCGKSTIIQLLMRYYDVDEGEILLDGKNIKEYDVSFLRYTNNQATDQQMHQAVELANCKKFIEADDFDVKQANPLSEEEKSKLGTGYQREVGAKGGQLSGGQKQRIAIARAIMKNPIIYLFDEATSALDNESEKLVQSSLEQISEGKTTISIAHRFSTIKNCDKILAFKEGKIVEQGTYNELTEKKGYFYSLERGLQ